MASVLRGEIWWANLDPVQGSEQAGRRPVLILSKTSFNERSGTVIAVAITSQSPRAGFPFTAEVIDGNMPKRSWVKISQVRTMSKQRLDSRITIVPEKFLAHVTRGLDLILSPD